MNYKAGDRVKIKSLDWYNENKDEYGYIDCGSREFFTEMSDWCGKIATIKEIDKTNCYRLEEYDYEWTDEMIEGLAEEEAGLVDNLSSRWVNEFNLPDGYIFKDENGNVINAQKIVLEKKKKEYPKTYEECCEVMGVNHTNELDICEHCDYKTEITYYEDSLLVKIEALYKLLICRDAYWKIAGDEMGLGKPWSPDYDSGVNKYGIICMNGVVQESNPTTNWERHLNKVLDFPTEEMRDAFYENFKELIESVKELL